MNGSNPEAPSFRQVPEAAWRSLAGKRVYFGHQSVGYDIMNGILDLVKENPAIGLEIVETQDPEAFRKPVFAHAKNGENRRPSGKIEAFSDFVGGPLQGNVDIAFFKFCYVDVTSTTDVEALFREYRAAMGALHERYPAVVFVHVTVPLTVVQSGAKGWLKGLLGKPLEGAADDATRGRFNELLLREYRGKEPVFDLAGLEATLPDGTRRTFSSGGRTWDALVDGYARDGAHLNEAGRRWIASHLLVFLAELA